MASRLTRPVIRETSTEVFDRSKSRNLIVSVEPAGREGTFIGIRVKGTRETYRLGLTSIFNLAISAHEGKVRRKAKELEKAGIKARSAKAQAAKELAKELKS